MEDEELFIEADEPVEQSSFIEEPQEVPYEEAPSTLSETLVSYYAAALTKSPDEIQADLEAGMWPMLKAEANQKASENASVNALGRLYRVTEADNQDVIRELTDTIDLGGHIAPDIATIVTNGDSDFTNVEVKAIEKAVHIQRIIEKRRAAEPTGFWAGAGNFADLAISAVPQNVGSLIQKPFGGEFFEGDMTITGLAREMSQLIWMELPEGEFERRAEDIISRVEDAGLFTETNPMYLDSFWKNVMEGGFGTESKLAQLFTVFDVAAAGLGTGLKTGKTIAKLGNRSLAVETVVDGALRGTNPEGVVEGAAPAMINVDSSLSAPSLTIQRRLEAENAALGTIKQSKSGDLVTPEALATREEAVRARIAEDLAADSRREVNFGFRHGPTGIPYGVVALGTKGGVPFKKAAKPVAEKFAEQIGGRVVPTMDEGKEAWLVVKEYDIPTQGLGEATELAEVATGFLAGIMSTTARTSKRLDGMIKRGEASMVKNLRLIGREYRKIKRKTPRTEQRKVDSIFKDLRDDPIKNKRKGPVTEQEFSDMYVEKFKGNPPSQETMDFFKIVRDISDTDYYLNADILLRKAVNNKETMADFNGTYYRVKPAKDLEVGSPVYDPTTGKLRPSTETDKVYQISGASLKVEGIGKVLYAVKPNRTRRLYHSDVLAYNVGGHRTYTTDLPFYLVQEKGAAKLPGGYTTKQKNVTFGAVRTQDEVNDAVDSWNKVADAIARGEPENVIDDIVINNSRWNTNLTDAASFRRFADEQGLDPAQKITSKGDNENIVGESQGFTGEDTVGGAFAASLNSGKGRGSRPLLGYGGTELESLDPVRAIERGFAKSVARQSEQRYLYNAIEGWVKAAKANQKLGALSGSSSREIFETLELPKNYDWAQQLRAERETIRYRLSNTSSIVAKEKVALKKIADWAYGKGWDKGGKALDWASTQDPAGFIRSIAFHSKLGMFNPDQLYVQSSQLVNVLGITSATIGPIESARALAGVMPMRLALIEKIPPQALQRIAKVQSSITGITPEDFIALRDWIKSTGRAIVDRTAVEENNSVASLQKNKFLDYGQVFFNEGETYARLGAALANMKERRLLRPTEDIFDSRVTDSMLHRQDVLTASMTAASAAPWQKSLAAVPLQFTTYHVRMAEQLFTSSVLTPKERLSLGFTQFMVYGAAAIPMAGFMMDRQGYKGNINPNNELYQTVRYGALDLMLSAISGTDTALSTRLGVGEGLWDLFEGLFSDAGAETLVGPGGQIGLDLFRAAKDFTKNVVTGNFDHLTYDWNRFARNISSYNKAYGLQMATRHGISTSRNTGDVQMDDMSSSEIILKALGVPLEQEQMAWAAISNGQLDRKLLKTSLQELKRLDNAAVLLLKEGDIEGASKLMEDMGAILHAHRGIPAEYDSLMRDMRRDKGFSLIESVIDNLDRQGRTEFARQIEE